MLRIKGLVKRYRTGDLALKGIDLDVPEVEVIRAYPPERVTELDAARWEELLRGFASLGDVRVLVSNGATTTLPPPPPLPPGMPEPRASRCVKWEAWSAARANAVAGS